MMKISWPWPVVCLIGMGAAQDLRQQLHDAYQNPALLDFLDNLVGELVEVKQNMQYFMEGMENIEHT